MDKTTDKEEAFIVELESIVELLIVIQELSLARRSMSGIDLNVLLNLPIGVLTDIHKYFKDRNEY